MKPTSICRSGVFAVGSLVRATLRPVAKKKEVFSPPKFLPYEVLQAARQGDVAPLLQLRGEYTVPKELMKEISRNMIDNEGLNHQSRALSGETTTSSLLLDDKTSKSNSSTTGGNYLMKRSNNENNALDIAMGSSLDPSLIETVSLGDALSLYGGDENIVDTLSRERHSLDVNEIESSIPVLAPGGTNPPLSAQERQLFSAVTVGDFNKVEELILSKEVDVSTIHPEHGSTIMHLASVCLEPDNSTISANNLLSSSPSYVSSSSQKKTSELEEEEKEYIRKELVFEEGANNKDIGLMGTTSGIRIKLFELISDADRSLVEARAYNGSTPLHWAAGAGNLDAVDWLLRNGADPLMATHTWTTNYFSTGSGQTALHWAAQSGHEEVVKMLASAAPLGLVAVDEKGRNPMTVAEEEQTLSSNTYQALLAAGSDGWLELELTHEAPLSRAL